MTTFGERVVRGSIVVFVLGVVLSAMSISIAPQRLQPAAVGYWMAFFLIGSGVVPTLVQHRHGVIQRRRFRLVWMVFQCVAVGALVLGLTRSASTSWMWTAGLSLATLVVLLLLGLAGSTSSLGNSASVQSHGDGGTTHLPDSAQELAALVDGEYDEPNVRKFSFEFTENPDAPGEVGELIMSGPGFWGRLSDRTPQALASADQLHLALCAWRRLLSLEKSLQGPSGKTPADDPYLEEMRKHLYLPTDFYDRLDAICEARLAARADSNDTTTTTTAGSRNSDD